MASHKDVTVELMSYLPKGTPRQGHQGLGCMGTEDRTQAQQEAAAEPGGLVRLRRLGLEAGEPVVCLPMDGGSLGLGREALCGGLHSGSPTH